MTLDYRPEEPVDFSTSGANEIHYWWKHPNLHGWMRRLYRDKGGRDADFNCAAVELDESDLDCLEHDIKFGNPMEMSGFTFCVSDGEEAEDDLVFIAKARAALALGLTVFYTSWW